MNLIHYMRILSKKEVKKMHKEMVDWVKKTLESNGDPYFLYDILLGLKKQSEKIEKELGRKGGENE